MHSFGDFQQFNPHLHMISTDGSFSASGAFAVAGHTVAEDLEEVFRHEVFRLHEAERKINAAVIENMLGWHHSGFNVSCGPVIWSGFEG